MGLVLLILGVVFLESQEVNVSEHIKGWEMVLLAVWAGATDIIG
jgi:hypothetical protein